MSHFGSATAIAFVNVADRARGLAFYRDRLGFAHTSADDFGDFLDVCGTLVRLTALADHVAAQHPVLGWKVADIAASIRELVAKGIAFSIYDGFGQDALGIWTAPDGKAKIAWFTDDDGNILSLTES